ncbi:MAG: gluconate 2-dehydrogenase subunit 3 family protein [bacterium]|nr:gluconate 2-dehydrogenase subunit 3 family protein [bacterium]
MTSLPVSRRGFLQIGGAASAVIAGGGAGLGCFGSPPPVDPSLAAERPEILSRDELVVLAALAERVIAPAPGGPTPLEARVARRIDRELAIVGGRLASDVPAALTLIEFGPWLDLRPSRFTSLEVEAQDDFLRSCERSGWLVRRQAYAGLRLLCLFFYYSDDRSWPSIGYAGPMVARKLPEAANAIEALDHPLGGARS